MKKFLKPTISKIILTVLLASTDFFGPFSGIAYIFYPIHFINNLFISKDSVGNLISTGAQDYLNLLFIFGIVLPVIVESYLISCAIFYIISKLANKKD